MALVVFWLIMGGVVAVVANSKGFDTVGWLIYGVLIWPIALAHVIVKPAVAARTASPAAASVPSEPTRACPDCAETIKAAAVVCRYCGKRDLTPAPVTELSEEDAWFASLDAPTAKPQPTTWQKLWWNPHAEDKRRR